MNKQSILDFFKPIDAPYRTEYRLYTNEQNISTNKLLAQLGIFFFFALFVLDYARHQKGELFGNPLHEKLMLTHLTLGLFFIPYFWIFFRRKTIRAQQFSNAGNLTKLNLIILSLSMLPMTIFSAMDRGSVATFGIYILICNLVFPLHHKERIALNIGRMRQTDWEQAH